MYARHFTQSKTNNKLKSKKEKNPHPATHAIHPACIFSQNIFILYTKTLTLHNVNALTMIINYLEANTRSIMVVMGASGEAV